MVTIAIPAYKDKYLSEAIDSALNQSYKDLELVIVNDQSPHNLDRIVNKYKDRRIRYYKNEENLGNLSIVHNWNKCLSYAKGEYFILLCDDDILLPNFVEELLVLAIKYPECNTFHARKINKEKNGALIESITWPEYEDYKSFLSNRLEKKRQHTITEFMYRTEYIKRTGYLVYPTGFYADNASIINWCKEGGIASSKECLCIFRLSDDHISSNVNPKYNYGKAKAAIQYWNWITKEEEAQKHIAKIKEDVESTFFNSFMGSNFILKCYLLIKIPNQAVSIKHKCGFIINALKKNIK